MSADKPDTLLQERARLTDFLYSSPYDLVAYIDRAKVYERLGFPDLVAGDAYKALLLTDEVRDESGEYHEGAVEALRGRMETSRSGACLTHGLSNGHADADDDDDVDDELDPALAAYLLPLTHQIYTLLVTALIQTSCLKSALEYHARAEVLPASTETPYPTTSNSSSLLTLARTVISPPPSALTSITIPSLPADKGTSRRVLYPWNTHEPDRYSPASLAFLNAEMAKVAPKCEVRVTRLPVLQAPSSPLQTVPQLGVFARSPILPDEAFLSEPTVLTANNRLHAPLCDCCSTAFPPPTSPSFSLITPCPTCDDTIFCTPTCHALAASLYHPAVCGKPDLDTIGRPALTGRPPDPDELYLLLLGRSLAIAFTQALHPLDLPETRFLWGALSPAATLPFSFDHAIATPLHLLEKMDVDVFAHLQETDTWVLQTLYAKFRGTASARMSERDGRVEVAGVHWRWALANHGCEPNCGWRWGGRMVYRAREKGVGEGEEVLNHYCDVELGVRERREWMMGTLGGECACARCVREAKEEAETNGEAKQKQVGDESVQPSINGVHIEELDAE